MTVYYPNELRAPISTVCEEDEQEKEFDRLVHLWAKDEIPFSVLVKNYPEYETSMPRRILSCLSEALARAGL